MQAISMWAGQLHHSQEGNVQEPLQSTREEGDPTHRSASIAQLENRVTERLERFVTDSHTQMEANMDERMGKLMEQVALLQATVTKLVSEPQV